MQAKCVCGGGGGGREVKTEKHTYILDDEFQVSPTLNNISLRNQFTRLAKNSRRA